MSEKPTQREYPDIRQFREETYQLISSFDAPFDRFYLDDKGIPTIGVGFALAVKKEANGANDKKFELYTMDVIRNFLKDGRGANFSELHVPVESELTGLIGALNNEPAFGMFVKPPEGMTAIESIEFLRQNYPNIHYNRLKDSSTGSTSGDSGGYGGRVR